jgi:tyrosine-protein kinase Etk/Wzc
MSTPDGITQSAAGSDADDEISLLDLLLVLAVHKKLILGLPAAVALLAVVVSLLLPNIYTGTARILPPQQAQSSAAALLGQLAGGAGGGVASALGIKNPNDLYVGMLKSRSIADRMVARFDLLVRYEAEYLEAARRQLAESTRISSGKDGLITIEVDDPDPRRAADMANAYVEELSVMMRSLAVTEAGQRRLFFESQMKQASESLARAEFALKEGLDVTGIVMADAQGAAMVETVARLRAQISAKEVQLGAMRTFAAADNPDYRMAQQELASMQRELAQLEGRAPKVDSRPASAGVPEQSGMENLRRLRDVKYYQALYEFLGKQYEIARIDEAKDAALIQVLDWATPPERKSKPRRALIVILSTLAAGLVAVLLAFIREALNKASQQPESAARLAALRSALRWRS